MRRNPGRRLCDRVVIGGSGFGDGETEETLKKGNDSGDSPPDGYALGNDKELTKKVLPEEK